MDKFYRNSHKKKNLESAIKNYNKCLNLALKIHKIFKCKTLSRIDFIFNKKQNKIYFLEINSQPGMTKMSLLPEQANYQKIKFENWKLLKIENR